MTITETEARALVDASLSEARRMGIKITAAVVDAGGNLVFLARMDGAGFLTPQIAEAKAFSSAAWGTPTARIAERARAKLETFQAYSQIGRTALVPGQGGQPVRRNGEIIGALGISGGTGEQDEAICSAVLMK